MWYDLHYVVIPSKEFAQADFLCKTINDILKKFKYKSLYTSTAFVRYDKNDKITEYLSSKCDLRIIWGGDATIENVYGGLLETLASLSHKISFPEIAVPALAQIKTFLKKCKIAKYSKKLKAVLDQIQENSKFVQDKRSKVTFGVKDLDQIGTFEAHLKAWLTQ